MPTKIEWCDETWNPLSGCTPVSEGCANCCAAAMCRRFGKKWGRKNGNDFSKVEFHEDKLGIPAKWKNPRRIFVNLMSDTFGEQVRTDWILQILSAAQNAPQHTYMFLTKRPERTSALTHYFNDNPRWMLGVTVENQRRADERIPRLSHIPPQSRFISAEPLLEAIGIYRYLRNRQIRWVICGAETGPCARPMNIDWALQLRRQCSIAEVPFFFKKAGNKIATPKDLQIREFPEQSF